MARVVVDLSTESIAERSREVKLLPAEVRRDPPEDLRCSRAQLVVLGFSVVAGRDALSVSPFLIPHGAPVIRIYSSPLRHVVGIDRRADLKDSGGRACDITTVADDNGLGDVLA